VFDQLKAGVCEEAGIEGGLETFDVCESHDSQSMES
jgi:hypothetical protein